MNKPIEETMEYATQRVNRSSAPSDLKITDLRIAFVVGRSHAVPGHSH